MPIDANFNATTVGTKGAVVALNTAAAASVTLANSTAINMSNYSGGSLTFIVNSGSGTLSIAPMVADSLTGTFVVPYTQGADNSTVAATAAIVTTTTVSANYMIKGIYANALKLVPTLSGTLNYTMTFTPFR